MKRVWKINHHYDDYECIMYEFMAPIVGFKYKFYEYSTFDKLMIKLRKDINDGHPVVIGALDMYHLSYLNMI